MTQFTLNRANPFDAVDDEYTIDSHPDITIQYAPYDRQTPYIVNVWVEAEEAMYHYPCRTFAAAKAKAIELMA